MALLVWLPLNGNLNNLGLSNVTIINSGATVDNNGKIGKCYSFNGSNNNLSYTPNVDELSAFSIALWLCPTSTTPSGAFFSLEHDTYWQVTLYNTSVGIRDNSIGYNGTRKNFSTGTYIANIWTHLVITYNNGTLKIYRDGILLSTNSVGGTKLNTGINNARIGSAVQSGYYHSGKINDFRFYDHCLSSKEVHEIAKGLVLHYKLDGGNFEFTKNLITSITKGGQTTVTDNVVTTSGQNADTYFTLNLSENIEIGTQYTIQCEAEMPPGIDFIFPIGQQNNSSLRWILTNGHNEYTFIANDISWGNNRVFLDDNGGNARSQGAICKFYNFQLEKKDHSTSFIGYGKNIGTTYDKKIYQEPDGTSWLRIFHHNNPGNSRFESTDNFSSGVYKSEDVWFDVYSINDLPEFEFMVKLKTTSDASEVKYRWILYKNPLTAVWEDVLPTKVTRITTSGYTNGTYGGLYKLGTNTHMVIANGSKGNWYGAIGCWTLWNNGMPGYPNTGITTGYLDLYVNITNTPLCKIHDYSGYQNDGKVVGNLTISKESPRYNLNTKFEGHNCYFLSKNPFYNNVLPITVSFWFKPNSSNGSYNTVVSNTYPHGGFWIGVNNESTGCWSYNSGLYVHGRSGKLTNGIWYHIVWQFKGDNLYLWYLNGNEIETYISGTLKAPVFTEYLNVGGCLCSDTSTSSSRYDLYGNISDLRFYSSVLSLSDILELYNTSALIDNKGNLFGYLFNELRYNIAYDANYGIISKQYIGGLSSYTQSNCSCSLTDTGYRIYRPPNVNPTDNGSTMWGGFILRNSNNIYNFEDGHTYVLEFDIKGQSSNYAEMGWYNSAGWSGGGLLPAPSNVVHNNPVGTNFNSTEWKHYFYKWTINDGVYKVCTNTYSSFVEGTTYVSYRDFKFGFSYKDTGLLGTDLYIKNLSLYDITDNTNIDIFKAGIINTGNFVEEYNESKFLFDNAINSNQLIEI